MRKVTETIVDAFLGRTPKSSGNSHTDGNGLYLHGNRIAWHGEQNGASGVFLTLAGWNTNTTKERLRGVLRTMGHQAGHVDGRPVLSIWTAKGQTLLGDVSRLNGEAFDLGSNAVAFVAHPKTAVGLAAVSVLGGWTPELAADLAAGKRG